MFITILIHSQMMGNPNLQSEIRNVIDSKGLVHEGDDLGRR
jgi:hypothetical protein